MGQHHEILLRLIRLTLANGRADARDLELALSDPRRLDPVEKAAWIELYFWSEDAPVSRNGRSWRQL
jgi:hypothetical protein